MLAYQWLYKIEHSNSETSIDAAPSLRSFDMSALIMKIMVSKCAKKVGHALENDGTHFVYSKV